MASAPSKRPYVWLLATLAVAMLISFAAKLDKNQPPHDANTPATLTDTPLPTGQTTHRGDDSRRSRRDIHAAPRDPRAAFPPPRAATRPAATATPEAGDAYLGTSLLEMEPGYNLDEVCTLAGQEFNVPPDLLKAVAFVESEGQHGSGRANARGGRGLMGLRDTPEHDTLHEAARLLGLPPADLVRDPLQNARGAAALLRQYHNEATANNPSGPTATRSHQENPTNLSATANHETPTPPPNPVTPEPLSSTWVTALSYYSTLPPEQSVTYTQDISNILQEGATFPTPDGTTATITPNQNWGE